MARIRLTTTAKIFIAVVILGVVAIIFWLNPGLIGKVAPIATKQSSSVPPIASLPGETGNMPTATDAPPGCATLPEVRFMHWAWNAQMGMMLATGGKQAVAGSIMCQKGVNLKLIREDNTDNMQAALVAFAEALKKGEANPTAGTHFVAIMGDGGATFLKGLNDKLAKIGPDYIAIVVGSAGYSRGEDKFMGPPAWKANPQAAKGGLVAGVLRDGDWNIALKWLGDNRIPNNPDETTYDPDALNWVNATDYIEAAQKYVGGFCTELKTKAGGKEKHCVNGVVTWTPGDVTVAEQKGGLVSIVSTKEYRSQMPNVIIGNKKWMAANRKLVTGMLSAIFDGGDKVKSSDDSLRQAAAVSALVYKEKDTAYWYKYFKVVNQKDKQGLDVELGGSTVNNLADNLQLFGMATGATNAFAATYTVFGEVVKSQYPQLVPSFYPVEQVLDTSYIKDLEAQGSPSTAPDLAKFSGDQKIQNVVSKKSWDIQFASGAAAFSPETTATLKALLADLVVASGTIVEIHGHTDNAGNADANMKLSEDRAFAVKQWLEKQAPTSFPEGRIKVVAHGQTEPVAPNSTKEGQAKNRRVVIVLGTS